MKDQFVPYELAVKLKEMENEKFPNGITSYLETFYEIVSFIELHGELPKVTETQETQGHSGLYVLAEEMADLFEKENKGRQWDGEWFEEIWSFCVEHLNNV